MGWEEFLNKRVRVIQKDGFPKFGTLKDMDEEFIFLDLDDGTPDAIRKDFVASVVPNREGLK